MKEIKYGQWAANPEVIEDIVLPKELVRVTPIWRKMAIKHEGSILYFKYWNFWVRAGVDADMRSDHFFRDYERENAQTDALLRDVGFPWRKAETEEEVWNRIGMVWNWMKDHVQDNNAEYANISSVASEWPSILDFARYYAAHGHLVWAACFSKAHLFATLLGRVIYPRFRFAVATGHHAEGGAPPTASHVFVAAYVKDRWFYLDPTAVGIKDFPDFEHATSLGVDSFSTVDYEHPFKIIPIPLSGLQYVPYLPK